MRVNGTILGGILALSSAGAVANASVVLTPDVGSYTAGSGAIGTVTSSYVVSTSYAEAGLSWSWGGTTETRGVIEIGLGTLPSNITINSASLQFGLSDFSDPTNAHSSLKIYGYSADGVISKSDYSKATGTALATIDASNSVSTYTVDVTSFLRSLVTSGASFAGFVADDTGDGSPDSWYTFSNYYSASRPGNSTGPRLVVDYTINPSGSAPVPEPASLAIVAAPIAGLLMRRRKSNRA